MNYKYNLKNALTYFYKDEKFAKKFGLGYLIIVLSMALNPSSYKNFSDIIVYLIGIILLFIFHGYIINNSHIRIFKPENKIPDWLELFSLFKKGFLSTLGSTIFAIFLSIPLGLILFGIIYLTTSLKIPMSLSFILICLSVGLLIFLVILGACASYISYITDLKFKSCFNLKMINQILFKNFSLFIRYLCIIFVLTLILLISVIFLIAIPSFIISIAINVDEQAISYIIKSIAIILSPVATMYFSYIYSDINAQFIRQFSSSIG